MTTAPFPPNFHPIFPHLSLKMPCTLKRRLLHRFTRARARLACLFNRCPECRETPSPPPRPPNPEPPCTPSGGVLTRTPSPPPRPQVPELLCTPPPRRPSPRRSSPCTPSPCARSCGILATPRPSPPPRPRSPSPRPPVRGILVTRDFGVESDQVAGGNEDEDEIGPAPPIPPRNPLRGTRYEEMVAGRLPYPFSYRREIPMVNGDGEVGAKKEI
ncbi:hypothetical protein M011DRAFT_509619 [Sporormia fimetaria CBS 119925]|uniref:Uncharacterized protein n=1 Tax=Sporormia fimetaria CBS 119925 TaxID=1340428 RepID=A0A6A6VM20_9PLEO|nr:hypothetical protein M011DRAFT_509619 [Sporormia fimetaria CBS 119925]